MSNGLHEIAFEETGQTLYHVPPLRVVSATYSIEDTTRDEDASDRVIASGAASVDSYSANVNADSGRGQPNPRRINISGMGSPTIGRPYIIEASDGQAETKTLEAIGSTYLLMSTEVKGSYTNGDDVYGIQISASFPDGTAADESIFDDDRPLVVVWTYTIGDHQKIVDEQIRLVRGTATAQYLGQAEIVFNERWEELVTPMRAKPSAVRQLAKVCADWISPRLKYKGIDPDDFMRGEQGLDVLVERMALHAAENGFIPTNREQEAFVEDRRRSFASCWNDLVFGHPGRDVVDLDRDGVAKSTQSLRNGRLFRRA